MSRWHKSTCGEPDVHPLNSIPVCSTCRESAVWNPAPGCKAPGIPPWPKPPKDGKFQLWWPSSVSYTDSNDDDGNLNTPYSSPEVIVGGSYQTQARAFPADGPGVEEATLATTSPQAEAEAAPAPRCPPSQIVYAPRGGSIRDCLDADQDPMALGKAFHHSCGCSKVL